MPCPCRSCAQCGTRCLLGLITFLSSLLGLAPVGGHLYLRWPSCHQEMSSPFSTMVWRAQSKGTAHVRSQGRSRSRSAPRPSLRSLVPSVPPQLCPFLYFPDCSLSFRCLSPASVRQGFKYLSPGKGFSLLPAPERQGFVLRPHFLHNSAQVKFARVVNPQYDRNVLNFCQQLLEFLNSKERTGLRHQVINSYMPEES